MKARFLFASVFCAAFLLCGCGGRTASYRYKLTLSLNTPDGVKTGYNVVELTYFDVSIPMRGTMHTTRGQGIYVDLGPGRRPLIALLDHIDRANEGCKDGVCQFAEWQEDAPTWIIAKACLNAKEYREMNSAGGVVGGIDLIAKECRKPIPLTPSLSDLPELVTFNDVKDPKSVIAVDPADLSATLGPGVSWRSITIQTTGEPLTRDIDEHLPWVRGYKDNIPVAGIITGDHLHEFVNTGDFIKRN
jgi:hypothetical protein